jgi:hypothetical protein
LWCRINARERQAKATKGNKLGKVANLLLLVYDQFNSTAHFSHELQESMLIGDTMDSEIESIKLIFKHDPAIILEGKHPVVIIGPTSWKEYLKSS